MDTLSFIERIGITDPTAITVISVSLMLFFRLFYDTNNEVHETS